MGIKRIAESKTVPVREFIVSEDKPNCVGVRVIGTGGRYWFTEANIAKEIKQLENSLAFWREMLEVFRNWEE